MPGVLLLGLLASAAFGQAPGLAGSGVADAFRLGSLTLSLPAGQSVGPRRAGALCLPAGGIAWREARPDGDEAREAVVRALGTAGLEVRPADLAAVDDVTPARYGLKGEVVALRLSACVPPGGLGRLISRSHTVKGEGSIAVRWTVIDRRTQEVTRRLSCVGFPYRDSQGSLIDMTLAGLTAAALDLAAGVRGTASGQATAGDAFCRAAGERAGATPRSDMGRVG